ncbi:hypothetical protein FC756_15650 [Lysinibacillus mangiferihumi]|uniref:Uncharacterized protein n=1 Tax=Lysinibacillus mangiferihumi TaxID=1130819 RepID=A0A4U2YWA3_9BACI|nr:hypothetical protein [Lysinibacillus mangiferihumi]TKI65966.1 hypothetical protein FC756_15650 [Lysinibacillus mangiferihumi]
MKGYGFSPSTTKVFLKNDKQAKQQSNSVFVRQLRIPIATNKKSTAKNLINHQTALKVAYFVNMPLAPINDLPNSIIKNGYTFRNCYHSEKQIARWLVKKSEYNRARHKLHHYY